MNNILYLLVFFSIILSCKVQNTVQNVSIKITSFPQENLSCRAILPLSKDTVYYAGNDGKIGWTFNAGKTWHKQTILYQDTLKPEFRSIATNGKAVFVLSVASPALLYKIENTKVELVYQEAHKKVFYDAMAFFDSLHGMAIGDPIDDCLSVITTSDGGKTWQKKPRTALPKTYEGEAAFAASNSSIKIYKERVWFVTGGSHARVFRSDNGGKTWQVFTTPFVQGTPSQGIYSVDFFDKNHGIIIGGDYVNPTLNDRNKAITTDGGKTWTLVADSKDPDYRSCVQYIPQTKGQQILAVGKRGISISKDGGETCEKIATDDFYTLRFVDSKTAWLAGNNTIGLLKIQ